MRRIFALLVTFVLLAAACGGGDDDADAAPTPPEAPAESTEPGEAPPSPPVTNEAGGGTEAGLVETLGLTECPVGAHLDAAGPVEIQVWHPYTALTEEALQTLAADFNASQSDIVVTMQAQGSYGELAGKYRESINFDDLPAIAIFDAYAFRDVVDSGTALPAQSCIESEQYALDEIDEIVRAFNSLDGALYPGAMNVSTPVLYYNRDHFEAAGLDPDDPPETVAELREYAQAIKDAGVAPTPLSLLHQGWFVDTWLHGAGVEVIDEANGRSGPATKATFNGPEALDLYTTLAEMRDAGLITSFSNTPGEIGHYLAVAGGNASMVLETSTASTTVAGVLGGTANLSELVDQANAAGADISGATDLNVNIDVGPFPGIESPGQVFVAGGSWWMTNTVPPEQQAAAWEFLKFVNQAESQKTIHLLGSYLPINPQVKNDPEVQAVWENDSAGQWLATSYAQYAAVDPAFPGPAVGPFTEQRAALNKSLDQLFLADGDPAAVLAEAEAAINEAITNYNDSNF